MSKGVQLIGRTTDFRGLSLWEIVGNLRDYGIGRLVIRNMFQRYPEPCYFRILKVDNTNEDYDAQGVRRVRVTVEKTWRGVTLPKPVVLFSSTYKADFELVPKNEEEKYIKNSKKVEEKIMNNKIEFPPLLREFITQETGQKQPMMDVHFKTNANKFVRLAKGNEKPNVELTMGLGKPISPKLYEGLL